MSSDKENAETTNIKKDDSGIGDFQERVEPWPDPPNPPEPQEGK